MIQELFDDEREGDLENKLTQKLIGFTEQVMGATSKNYVISR